MTMELKLKVGQDNQGMRRMLVSVGGLDCAWQALAKAAPLLNLRSARDDNSCRGALLQRPSCEATLV